jgi:hypothetical protein
MSRRFLQSFRMFEEGVRHRVVYSRPINRFRFFHVENDDRSRDDRDHRRVVRETGIDQDQCEVFEQDVVSEALTNTCTRHMILTGCYSGTGNYLLCSFEVRRSFVRRRSGRSSILQFFSERGQLGRLAAGGQRNSRTCGQRVRGWHRCGLDCVQSSVL